MEFVFEWLSRLAPARFVLKAIVVSLLGIGLLLAFILGRRAYRRHYFRRRNEREYALRKKWDAIVSGAMPPETWRSNRLDREVVETILLDSLEVAPPGEASRLLGCLRSSGLLDMRIYQARAFRGWRRERALVTLGRTRAPEAIPALAEGLDDPNQETRVAALRGLGRTALPEAAVSILDRLMAGSLRVPAPPVQNALLHCCRGRPSLLVPHLLRAEGSLRELLARVLGELATLELETDLLLLLAADPLAEVRASAARALAEAKPEAALTVLSQLARDPEWFVRLRAVVGLGELGNPRAIPVLIRALCDASRYVRLRAAAALARLQPHLEQILEQVVETQDRYALQAMISEVERTGVMQKLVDALADSARPHAAGEILLEALRAGAAQLRGAVAESPKPEEVVG